MLHPLPRRAHHAPWLPPLLALLVTALAPSTLAQPFVDRGPDFGLPSLSSNPTGQSLVAGLSMGDLDGDGDLDLLTTTPHHGLVVYLREGATFTPAPFFIPAQNTPGDAYGHTLFDMDGDGDLDLFVARDDGDVLYENEGQRLVDATSTRLPHLASWSSTATPVDLDGDGDLDLLVARYIDRIDFPAHRCFDNRVLDNDGRGYFRDVSRELGIAGRRGCSFSMIALDVDDDLDLDLLTVNDFAQFTGSTELWRNEGRGEDGHLRFTEVGAELGLVAPVYGMGAAFGDLDEDGQPELFLTNIGEPMLFERTADGRFVDAAVPKNLFARFAHDRHQVTWTARFLDLDADGYLDVLGAGGNLPAAPFIGNPTDMGSLWLRGQPDGGLRVPPVALDLPRPQHSARDFHRADLDGDGRPELMAIHIHGRVSAYASTSPPPRPITLALRPTTTGPGAAGAFVTLTCGATTRTRYVTAGGDYGVAPEPLYVHFPAPCAAPGQAVAGEIRWPSGYRQTFTTQTGQALTVTEPAWLTLGAGLVELDLSGHAGPIDTVALGGHGLDLGPLEALGPRRWRASVAPLDAATGGQLDLLVDGRVWGAHPRIDGLAPHILFDRVYPVAGKSPQLTAVFPSDPGLVRAAIGGVETTLTRVSDTVRTAPVSLPTTPGPATLELRTATDTTPFALTLEPPVSTDTSELVVRELHILASDIPIRRVRLRARLFDRNGDPAGVALASLGVRIDGIAVEPDARTTEPGYQTVNVEHTRLKHGSKVQLTLDGEPLFRPQTALQLTTASELGQYASPTRSRCFFSEPRLRGDGADRGTVLIQFSDAEGNRLPDLGQRPTVQASLLNPLHASLEVAYGGWAMETQTTLTPGRAELRTTLPGLVEPIRCGVDVVRPPTLPRPQPRSPLIALQGDPKPGELVVFRFWPLDIDGRSLGSGVPLNVSLLGGALYATPSYIGLGRYEIAAVPLGPGVIGLTIDDADGVELASLSLVISDDTGPDGDPEPGPESAEVVEAENAEVVEAEPEVVEAVEDAQSDADLPPPDTADTSEDTLAEVAEPDADTSIFEDSSTPDPDPADTLTPDTAAPDTLTLADPEPRPRRDEGCAGGPGSLAPLLGLAALCLKARARPPRRAR